MLKNLIEVHDITVLAETKTTTNTMVAKSTWAAQGDTRRGRAVQIKGGQRLVTMQQRGFKRPWVFLFVTDPQLNQDRNRLRYTDTFGETHDVVIRSYRYAAGFAGDGSEVWAVEGDECTPQGSSPSA